MKPEKTLIYDAPKTGRFALSAESPDMLSFFGRVENEYLYELISQCDVIINPHVSISKMKNGVFPFKVIEAIASARLLISTPVPSVGMRNILEGVQFVDCTEDSFYHAVLGARRRYLETSLLVSNCAELADESFGEVSLLSKILNVMG